jgi:bifunctional non-homologous end joining protein LigD
MSLGTLMRHIRWARPELVTQVRFTEWTEQGRLRHASYVGLREDKSAEEVLRE